MRIIFLLVLVAGLGLAGYATYLIIQQFEGYQSQVVRLKNELRISRENEVETTPVIVAAGPLKFGTELTPEGVRAVNWPATEIPLNSFTSMEALFGVENTPSRFIIRIMEDGEPIMTTKVTEFGEDAGLRSRLTPGMRAFTIRVDVETGVSGFLQPGDRVDVYWTSSGSNESVITKLILEGAALIAIDQSSSEDTSRPSVAKTVTLEVSPQIVAKLVQAQQTGSLTLALRGVEDAALVGSIEVDQNDINPIDIITLAEDRICIRRERRGVDIVEIVVPCPTE